MAWPLRGHPFCGHCTAASATAKIRHHRRTIHTLATSIVVVTAITVAIEIVYSTTLIMLCDFGRKAFFHYACKYVSTIIHARVLQLKKRFWCQELCQVNPFAPGLATSLEHMPLSPH